MDHHGAVSYTMITDAAYVAAINVPIMSPAISAARM
jgi:hypothetical protein